MFKWPLVSFIIGIFIGAGVIILLSIAGMVWAYLHAEEAPPGMAEMEWRGR